MAGVPPSLRHIRKDALRYNGYSARILSGDEEPKNENGGMLEAEEEKSCRITSKKDRMAGTVAAHDYQRPLTPCFTLARVFSTLEGLVVWNASLGPHLRGRSVSQCA